MSKRAALPDPAVPYLVASAARWRSTLEELWSSLASNTLRSLLVLWLGIFDDFHTEPYGAKVRALGPRPHCVVSASGNENAQEKEHHYGPISILRYGGMEDPTTL